ncbi:MAG: T9SS type A sorting domain-containing protein [Bacteroidales bacterium]|jgi:hypothetical protein|nr:T9SS type A sorting domain-containing protein [Bacteroidales bacterium]
MKQSIQLFAIICLMVFGQGIQPLSAQVIMKSSTGETTEITSESPLLAENGEPIVWITKDNQNNRAVINITCNQSMLSNDYNNLTTFYRDNLGDVFALHYSGEPEVWNWEWRLDDYTLLASDPSETYTTSGSLTGNVSYGQNSTYGSGVQYTYAGYFTLADPYGGGETQFSATIQTIDSQTGDLFIEGANIDVVGVGNQSTDAIGYATFQDLTNGEYSYTVEASGYPDVDGEFTISNEDVFIQIDYSAGQTYEALFSLTEVGTSNTIANANVTVTGLGTQITNASGQTTFTDLENGTYFFNIIANGYEDYIGGQFTIDDWGASLPIALTPSTSYYDADFTVLDFNSSLVVENASITIDGVGTESSDVNGQASFIDLADGTYNYTVTADGYQFYPSDFTINGGDEAINVALVQEMTGNNVYFTITDDITNAYVENAIISIDGIGNETSDANGEATFIIYAEGLYTYSVTADGYDPYSFEFICGGGDEHINVSLTPTEVGINHNNLSAVQISPNPAHSLIQVQTNLFAENLSLSFYDISGKLVQTFKIESAISHIDISTFDKGMYLYSISSETSEIVTGKFVKH